MLVLPLLQLLPVVPTLCIPGSQASIPAKNSHQYCNLSHWRAIVAHLFFVATAGLGSSNDVLNYAK
jgi:hypothetical protein